jgi:hypothetical protein
VIDLNETPDGKLILPDGRIIAPQLATDENGTQRVPGMLTRSEWEQLDAVLRSQFFLFPNGTGSSGDYGERMVCRARNPDGTMRGCGRKHSHITTNCVELPFKGGTGLEAGLFTLFRAAKDQVKAQQLQNAIAHLPDIARGHPFSAGQWAPKTPGENWLAALISYPEPITKETARKFGLRINESNPPVRLCLKESCENYLEADVWCSGRAHSYL